MFSRGEKILVGVLLIYLALGGAFWLSQIKIPRATVSATVLPAYQLAVYQPRGVSTFASVAAEMSNQPSAPAITPALAAEPPVVVTTPAPDPNRLQIPKIGIDARVQPVGKLANGNMATTIPTDVAWYKYGARPGEPGNAVLAGHRDTRFTNNGVFHNLDMLTIGDDIYVIDGYGKEFHFRVIGKKAYDANSDDPKEVFGTTSGARLNLITCAGDWNPRTRNYSDRLVVFTELAE